MISVTVAGTRCHMKGLDGPLVGVQEKVLQLWADCGELHCRAAEGLLTLA